MDVAARLKWSLCVSMTLIAPHAFVACGSKAAQSGFAQADPSADAGALADATGAESDGAEGQGDTPPSFGSPDSSAPAHDAAPPPEAVVYAHSANTLYKLDPTTKAVSVVGDFSGCSSVIDIAIDQSGNGYVTTYSAFYKVDLSTAVCTFVANGSYPNSLSFVPKGALDPNVESLVGYFGAKYVRIDPATGAVSTIGGLTGGYQSSVDIVSVIGGGTFLTVNGNGCNDCLLQVDPKTGNVVQSYGAVNHGSVFGLAFWAGTVYGFDDAGQMFSIAWQNGAIATTDIPVPSPPVGLAFWGAGSTTAAPAVAEDGGGIPIK